MKTLLRILTILTLTLSTHVMAFELEGLYELTDGGQCGNEKVDSIVLYSEADGSLRAAFSSAHYGIIYQNNALIWDGGTSLSGSSTPDSFTQGSFSASISADHLDLEGTVDSLACALPWSFKATRKELATTFPQLAPLGFLPALSSFNGSYAVTTERLEGHLKLMTLGDGRLVGSFGTEDVPQILKFTQPRLNTVDGTLELFDLGESDTLIKWHLQYGKYNNQLFLQGYAIGPTGRYYVVQAAAL